MVQNEMIRVDILATSDMHSSIMSEATEANIYRAGTYIRHVREMQPNMILLDSGGSLAGTMAAFYYAIIAPHKRHPMIKLMNALAYDASGMSANDFKFGLPFLDRSVALSRFPWLSANIELKRTKEPYFSSPYMIRRVGGIKIAIMGMTSEGLMARENIKLQNSLHFTPTIQTAKRWVNYIHETESPDYFIMLYHGGFHKMSKPQEKTAHNINEAEKIMEDLGVIDLMITGHQHETIIGRDNQTVYIQAGQNGEALIHTTLHFKKRTTSVELEDVQAVAVDLSQYDEDQSLLDLTAYDRKAVNHWSETYVVQPNMEATCEAHISAFDHVVRAPHPFVQLLHDAIRRGIDNDISCVHLPKNGAQGLSGCVTHGMVYEAYPHPDKPIEVSLKGDDIKTMLEYTYAHLAFDGRQLHQTHIDETMCNFWQGVHYDVDMSAIPFERVTLKGIQPHHTYRVTMTDYCYRQYETMMTDTHVMKMSEVTMPELMTQCLQDDTYTLYMKQSFQVRL